MADDATFQTTTPSYPPSTLVVAGDSIGGSLYQRIKLIFGADGSNSGDVASGNPLPVTSVNGGTFAVQATEADGANTTLGSKADAKSTATDTTAITVMQVLKQISASVQAPPSQAVTNAGTFAVTQGTASNLNATVVGTGTFAAQAAITAASGSIGSGAIASGAVASGAFASGAIGSGAVASGAIASGAVASGAFASGSIGSGAIASGAIAAGAIATGATSIATNEDVASADADTGVKVLFKRTDAPANSSGTDGDYEQPQMSNGRVWTAPLGFPVSCSTDITRPGDTTPYSANDIYSDSTSAPTSGGYTFTSAARKSGGSVLITDMWIASSNSTGAMQGEVWVFNQAVTNVNDNSAFAISDSEIKTVVCKVPFTTVADTNNAGVHVQNIAAIATASGTPNLRFLVKVKAAYTPANAEVLTVVLKGLQID